ncbi:MAG: transglutaminase domain-containing protein [Spirochaetales bacterium]|uniref:Transglutaminase domain-containing protein n=1 Tax=Candidatus Thalassospirochaeta sargassi TaxID=3119039 RepID=A0AAJ1MNK0_9SPIO|nr:transglutaminase domain-containing protein [Spirochaetales bacterium]
MRKLFSSKLFFHSARLTAAAVLLVPLYIYLEDILAVGFVAAVLFSAAAAGIITERAGLRFFPALIINTACAFLIRFLVIFVAGSISPAFNSSVLDFMPFSFDSGFFPLLPFYLYISICWFMVLRKPRFSVVEIILNLVVYCALLWSQGGYKLNLFPHPGILAVFGIIFFVTELAVLLLSNDDTPAPAKLAYALFVVPLFILMVFLFFGNYSEGASKDGGGLMQPTLFRFDFSDYVKLETEISMDNDLVLLFRNYGYLNSVYLRRFYLSGYKSERGFYMQRGPGEEEQYTALPDSVTRLDVVHYPERILSEQEYFIVNLDPSSLIAMNYPVEISPLTNWSDSSFLRNYRVVSESVEQPSWELAEAPLLEMDEALQDFYTDYGEDAEIKALAEEITAGIDNSYDKVIALMFYLHDNYFYSLKPGVAVDGNQLHHFLFDARKGYCSYFAFSMALMCRSIGIPARVAAGFFIDPQSGILNIYPVREDMAHAWVEVPFENYGWVEFDPTTDRLAAGEELEFAALDSSEYSNLVEEIISSDYSVELPDADAGADKGSGILSAAADRIKRFVVKHAALLLPIIYSVLVLLYRLHQAVSLRFSSPRRRIRAMYARAVRAAAVFGFGRQRGESVLEHARRLEGGPFGSLCPLAGLYLESVFAPGIDDQAAEKAGLAWKDFRASMKMLPIWKRLLSLILPFIRFRARLNPPAVLLLLILFLAPQLLQAQDSGSIQDFLDMAAMEEDAENYEAALRLLNQGMAEYPGNAELKIAAGDLYSDRELYNLALEQYTAANKLIPGDPEVLYRKSVSEGFLNLDQQSILTLEEILELVPDHYDAHADLGWMYFKTFRLAEAESLLLDGIEYYDDSPILYMTLGTVYSGMYDYERAEKYYLESIDMALDKGWDYFASVAYYNLSLLEHGFYKYKKALEYTNKSIEYGERAPGYIARAEIYLGKLDFDNAYLNYQQAYNIDSTPLALMGQAELYLNFGLLDEALSHINEVLKHDDDSWMYYFGVDPDRHRMETDRILMEIYNAMAERERFSPASGLGRLTALFDRIRYSVSGWYHGRRYRRASFDVGRSNERQGNSLDAAWAYFVANEDYAPQALRYLRRAEVIETAAAPAAEPYYMLETGRLTSDQAMLSMAAGQFNPEWERFQMAEAIAELLQTARRPDDGNYITLAEELYGLNPGYFITRGFQFPLELDYKPGFFLKHSLKRSGFYISLNNDDIRYRYRLSAADTLSEGVLYSVVDSETGKAILEFSMIDLPNTPQRASAVAAELKMRLFSITDGKDFHF